MIKHPFRSKLCKSLGVIEMKTDVDFTLSGEFEFGNSRLVLVKPGRVQGREVKKSAKDRLEKIFSSLKQETYTVEKAERRKLEELNGKIDLKGRLRELNFDRSLSKITGKLGDVIEDYQENRERKKRVTKVYESIAQGRPLSDAKLYQGGGEYLKIVKTTEFLSRLMEKEVNVDRSLENTEARVVDKFVQRTVQRVKDSPYEIRELKKRDYYKIIVCFEEFAANYLDKLIRVVSDEALSSMGSRLELPPGNVVLVESDGFQNRLEIRIPVELEEKLHPHPFQLTFE